jgi:hypothetical protein
MRPYQEITVASLLISQQDTEKMSGNSGKMHNSFVSKDTPRAGVFWREMRSEIHHV